MNGHGGKWVIVCTHLIEQPQQEWVPHGVDYLCRDCKATGGVVEDLEPLAVESMNGLRGTKQ